MRKHKILRKLSALGLSALLAVSSVVTGFAASAGDTVGGQSTGTMAIGIYGVKFTQDYALTRNTAGDNVRVHFFAPDSEGFTRADSQRAYCINPQTSVQLVEYNRTYYYGPDVNKSPQYSVLTNDQKKVINYLMCAGYGGNANISLSDPAAYYATQALIWEVAGYTENNKKVSLRNLTVQNDYQLAFAPNRDAKYPTLNPKTYYRVDTTNGEGYVDKNVKVDDIFRYYNSTFLTVSRALARPRVNGIMMAKSEKDIRGALPMVYNSNYAPGTNIPEKYVFTFTDQNYVLCDSPEQISSYFKKQYEGFGFRTKDVQVTDATGKTLSKGTDYAIISLRDGYKNNNQFDLVFNPHVATNYTGPFTVQVKNPWVRGMRELYEASTNKGLKVVDSASPAINQSYATGANDPADVFYYFRVDLPEIKIDLELQKVSANPSITEGNSCYSYADAQFEVYEKNDSGDDILVGTITTNDRGYGKLENAAYADKSYYAVETVSPKGYEKIDGKIDFELKDAGTQSAKFTATAEETPGTDPMFVFLKKEDPTHKAGEGDLEGATFEVKFYANDESEASSLDDIVQNGLTPTRTWVFKTDSLGYIELSESYKLSGDDLYYGITGRPVLPDGAVTIKELTPPTSGKYFVNEETFFRRVGPNAAVDVGLRPDNPLIVEEMPKGALSIIKKADDGIVGHIWFKITNDYNDTVLFLETNDTGSITVENLDQRKQNGEPITYTITELGVKTGENTYEIPKRYTPEVVEQSVQLSETGGAQVTFNNRTPKCELLIYKVASDGKTRDIYFKIVSSDGITRKGRTKANGSLVINGLPAYDKNGDLITYTVEELGSPDGNGGFYIAKRYYGVDNQTVSFENAVVGNINSKSLTFVNQEITGRLTVLKTSEDGRVKNVVFEVSATINGNKVVKTMTTGDNGSASATGLKVYDDNGNLIEYTIKELGFKQGDTTYFPKNYQPQAPQTFTFPESFDKENPPTYSVEFKNTLETINLNIHKTATDNTATKNTVKDIWFEVSCAALGYSKKVVTNNDGEANLTGLLACDEDGNYYTYKVKELGYNNGNGTYTIPERYVLLPEQSVDCESYVLAFPYDRDLRNADLYFNNAEVVSNLRVIKKAEDGITSGVTFSVTGSDGSSYIGTTNNKGIYTFEALKVFDGNNELISYTVKELGFADGHGGYYIPFRYELPSPQTVTLEYNRDPSFNEEGNLLFKDVTFNNVLKKGSITVYKSNSIQEPLEGVSFTLRDSKGDIVGEDTTDAQGKVEFKNLTVGKYTLYETKTVAGMELLSDPIQFNINGSSAEALYQTQRITNVELPNIPHTGDGMTVFGIIAGGVLVLAFGFAIVVIIVNKKKR